MASDHVFYVTGWEEGDKRHKAMEHKFDPTPWSYEKPVTVESPDHTTSNGPHGSPTFDYKARVTSPYLVNRPPSLYSAPPRMSAAELGRSGTEAKTRQCCSRTRLLLILLIFFICLSCVTLGIIIWIDQPCSKHQEALATAAPKKLEEDEGPKGCYFTPPKDIPVQTLLARLKDELNSLEEFIESGVKQGKASALSANIVYRDEVIWSGGFGVVDKNAESPRKASTSTVYPCASVSKIFTSLMMFKLYSDGSLRSLNEPLTNFEPRLTIKNPFNADSITLRQLASHRSGLQREAPCYPEKGNDLCPYDYETMLNRVNNLTLLRKPGGEPQYSNLGVALIGQVLSYYFNGGSGYEDYMRRILLDPLGLKDTTFTLTDSLKKKIPLVYLGNKEPGEIYDWAWLNPTGGVFSTVDDLAKIETALFTEKNVNRFLSKAATQELFTPEYIFPGGTSMVGLPWEMRLLDKYVVLAKGGSVYGYESLVSLIPEIKLAWNFICTDCRVVMKQLKHRLDQVAVLYTNISRREVEANAVLLPDTMPYIGTYKPENIPSIQLLEIKEMNGNLHVLVDDQRLFTLHYEGPFKFRMNAEENVECSTYFVLGMRNELLIFDRPTSGTERLSGFTMFGAHPSGKSHFYRVET